MGLLSIKWTWVRAMFHQLEILFVESYSLFFNCTWICCKRWWSGGNPWAMWCRTWPRTTRKTSSCLVTSNELIAKVANIRYMATKNCTSNNASINERRWTTAARCLAYRTMQTIKHHTIYHNCLFLNYSIIDKKSMKVPKSQEKMSMMSNLLFGC